MSKRSKVLIVIAAIAVVALGSAVALWSVGKLLEGSIVCLAAGTVVVALLLIYKPDAGQTENQISRNRNIISAALALLGLSGVVVALFLRSNEVLSEILLELGLGFLVVGLIVPFFFTVIKPMVINGKTSR
ncbi:hypothetical protein KJY77_01240 [Canibacter sp. lx-72]|uniref:hypothetical protein n=1 Tax=Canibacter zhuwentaonis TaxID=2837491 RepID=UPI001BDC4F86|nr:hypothetical protein [Canibacter zhuwentaonis]MBT1017767.1 hypothetical protein [Canibacter zhuwentaonis]